MLKLGPIALRGLVYVINVLRLGVQARVISAGVVDTILLITGDTDLHFEPETDSGHTLEVFGADLDILSLGS